MLPLVAASEFPRFLRNSDLLIATGLISPITLGVVPLAVLGFAG
jgi:hypothetical protein